MKHVDKHQILTDCQHDFRARRSCETQLITGQCIPWTKHTKSLGLGLVQVIISWTKWGVFLGPIPPSKHPTLDQRWNLVGFWSRRRRPKYNVGTTLNRRCQVHVQLLRRINVGYWLDFGRDRDDKSTTSVQRKIVMSVRRLITTSCRRIFT